MEECESKVAAEAQPKGSLRVLFRRSFVSHLSLMKKIQNVLDFNLKKAA